MSLQVLCAGRKGLCTIGSEAIVRKENATAETAVVRHLQQCQHKLSGKGDERCGLVEMVSSYSYHVNMQCCGLDGSGKIIPYKCRA